MGRSPAAPALVAVASVALLAGAVLLGRSGGDRAPGGSEAGEAVPAADTVPAAGDPTDVRPAGSGAISADLLAAPAVRAAVAMAARDAGVAESEVAVTDVREITWPSSALGCPQPDMMYLEVLTPGYRVMTFAAGARRIYHTNQGGTGDVLVVPCSTERSKQGVVDVPPEQLEAIRLDAAGRAEVPGAPVELLGVSPSTAATLTCDETGASDAAGSQALSSELIWDVTLRVGIREHRYRVSGRGFVHCGDRGVDEAGNPID